MDENQRLRRRVAELESLLEKLHRTVDQQAKVIEKMTVALEAARQAVTREAGQCRQGAATVEEERTGREKG